MGRRIDAIYQPMPYDIEAKCAFIHQQWRRLERRRRRVGVATETNEPTWSPPLICASTCLARVLKAEAEASA